MSRITIAKGDGIGPEIMEATLSILAAAGANLQVDEVEVGEKVYLAGHSAGISPEGWDTIRRNKVFLKAPITTPQGGGYKSLNVSTRKFLGLFANVRPCMALDPMVRTKHPGMDVVIVRENEEDLYAGIEHQQTDEVVQCLKLISRPGCVRIVRYAFEYARVHGRKKVTCFTKDNIMKQTDGLFHSVFDEIGEEYPEILKEHWIVDIGAAKLADTPEIFDVIVMPNLYGDVLSDVAAQIAGSVGLAGSANIGPECAMFEAIHGSAPRRAGQDMANPSGLLQGAVMMLVHLGQNDVAARIQNAWLTTLENGDHTYDIYQEGKSRRKLGTRSFAEAVISNLGKLPKTLTPVNFSGSEPVRVPVYHRQTPKLKTLVGVDVFLHWRGEHADELASGLQKLSADGMQLKMITNRGIKVWPGGFPETFCTDHWRCRFMGADESIVSARQIFGLMEKLEADGFDCVKTENLYLFDGKPGFSQGQGQ